MARKITHDDVDKFFEYGIHIPTRTIYAGSTAVVDGTDQETGTDYQMAEYLTKGLWILDHAAPAGDQPIKVVMNNLGGDEFHMFAMFDAIKRCLNHVTVLGTGYVMSAGSLIFQAADDRVLSPNAYMMIHYGTWGIHDHPKITRAWTKAGEKMDQKIARMYLERIQEKLPHYTYEQVDKLLDFDTILTAQEAVDLGLADRIEG